MRLAHFKSSKCVFQQDRAAVTTLLDTQPWDLSAIAEHIRVSLPHGKSGQNILVMEMVSWTLSKT